MTEMNLSLTSVPCPPPQKPVCQECGSDDVIADAFAYWDAEKQDWQVSQAFEKGGCCEACGAQDIRFDWVDV
jgi:hypothetical protein